ncbi:MAG: S1/P1 nuclease [Bdellovibrionales bacterium]|nr:S1/P1 nuclease [Bdellovibrionales bacterium]
MNIHINTNSKQFYFLKHWAVLIVSLFISINSFGWAELGHQVTAEIAEQILSQDAKTMSAIRSIVGLEPLAIGAAWPDIVKSDARFNDFSPYHYMTIYRDSKKSVSKNALTVLNRYPAILTDSRYSRESKMIAFRFILHVVGDIHQPLHVGNEFDYGGNACRVKWQPNAKSSGQETNLHSVWDEELVNNMATKMRSESKINYKFFGYKEVSNILMAKYKSLIASSSQDVDVDAWVADSQRLRETEVYPDKLADDARPYCSRGGHVSNVPVLDAQYINAKRDLVEKRLVLGGIHLANLLRKVFNRSTPTSPTESDIIAPLIISND